jgi:hypothetical protein
MIAADRGDGAITANLVLASSLIHQKTDCEKIEQSERFGDLPDNKHSTIRIPIRVTKTKYMYDTYTFIYC